jgi:hypothetical protein
MAVSSLSRSSLDSSQVFNFCAPCLFVERWKLTQPRRRHWLLPSLYCSSLSAGTDRLSPWFRALCNVVLHAHWTTRIWGYVFSSCLSIDPRLTPPPALLDHGIPSNIYFANGFFSGAVMLVGAVFALLAKLSIDRRLLKVV